MDWERVDPEPLFDVVRARGQGSDTERTVWAFERALAVARLDPELVRYLLIACVCVIAYEEGKPPRAVLEQLFRRSVSDGDWRDHFEQLFA